MSLSEVARYVLLTRDMQNFLDLTAIVFIFIISIHNHATKELDNRNMDHKRSPGIELSKFDLPLPRH